MFFPMSNVKNHPHHFEGKSEHWIKVTRPKSMDDPSDTFDQPIAIKSSIQTPKNTTQPIPLTPYNPNLSRIKDPSTSPNEKSLALIKTYFSTFEQKVIVFPGKNHGQWPTGPLDFPWIPRASGTFTVSSVGGTALATAPCSSQQVAPSGSTISTSQRPWRFGRTALSWGPHNSNVTMVYGT